MLNAIGTPTGSSSGAFMQLLISIAGTSYLVEKSESTIPKSTFQEKRTTAKGLILDCRLATYAIRGRLALLGIL